MYFPLIILVQHCSIRRCVATSKGIHFISLRWCKNL